MCCSFPPRPPILMERYLHFPCRTAYEGDVLKGTILPKRNNMEQRQLGRTDMRVSVLGFGGAEIGYEEASAETVARLLNSALDAGLNVIDTAECYLQSEELIGRAVSARRKEFYLFTKCG